MKSGIYKILSFLTLVSLVSCNNKVIETGNKNVIHEEKFNSAYIDMQNEDFTKDGFTFGDSCNVYFSNGLKIEDVPYYDGYYTRSDYPLVCGYQGYPYVQITINNCSDFYDRYELNDYTKVNVVLNEKGKYKDVQEAFSMHYLNDRDQFPSDEVFANFRMIHTSNIKENILFRGASPFNDTYNRAPYVDNLLNKNDAKFILDLSDTEADIDDYVTNQPNYNPLDTYAYAQDKVFLGLGSNFRGVLGEEDDPNIPEQDLLGIFGVVDYKTNLVKGLNEMIKSSGPYYVHCVEGKDRTGFVSMLLEGLCGATYEEMKTDYMITYYNYFGITESDPKYEAVCHLRFDEFLEYLSGTTDIKGLSYVEYCKNYLKAGGMTEDNINLLINRLTK